MGSGEATPVCCHTRRDMHLIETYVSEKLHQPLVNRTLRVGRHFALPHTDDPHPVVHSVGDIQMTLGVYPAAVRTF